MSGTINADETNKQKKLTIRWKWDYETGKEIAEIIKNDKQDTQDSKTMKDYTFQISITATQVVPQS